MPFWGLLGAFPGAFGAFLPLDISYLAKNPPRKRGVVIHWRLELQTL